MAGTQPAGISATLPPPLLPWPPPPPLLRQRPRCRCRRRGPGPSPDSPLPGRRRSPAAASAAARPCSSILPLPPALWLARLCREVPAAAGVAAPSPSSPSLPASEVVHEQEVLPPSSWLLDCMEQVATEEQGQGQAAMRPTRDGTLIATLVAALLHALSASRLQQRTALLPPAASRQPESRCRRSCDCRPHPPGAAGALPGAAREAVAAIAATVAAAPEAPPAAAPHPALLSRPRSEQQ